MSDAPFRVIAERALELRGPAERTVVVRIGVPEADPAGSDNSRCPFQVTGLSDDSVRYAHGVDTLQALNLAFVGARALVAANAGVLAAFHEDFSLTWEGVPWQVSLPVWVSLDDAAQGERLEAFIRGSSRAPPGADP